MITVVPNISKIQYWLTYGMQLYMTIIAFCNSKINYCKTLVKYGPKYILIGA